MPEQEETQNAESTAASVGALLTAAREQAGLTSEELARRLCMTTENLEALERDAFDAFPGATYIRGYIRNVCKELRVDETAALEAFVRQVPAEAPRVAQPPKGSVMGGSVSGSGASMSGPMLLVAAIAVAGGYWWFEMRGNDGAMPAPAVATQASQEVVEQPAATEVDDIAQDMAESDSALDAQTLSVAGADTDVAAEEVVPETDVQLADVADLASEDAEVEGAVEEPAVTEMAAQPVAAPVPEPVVAVEEPAVQQETSSMVDEAPVGAVSSAVLAISFSEESWVEVTDAAGNKLLAKLQPAGSTVELEGQAPFSLMLGNAAATTVSYAGEVVDSAPLGNRRTRKLTVGG